MQKIVPLSEEKIPTILSLNSSLEYVIGDEAREGGLAGVTSAYSFKKDVGLPDSSYTKGIQYWVAPGADTKDARVLSAKDVADKYLKILLESFAKNETPDSWIIGTPPIHDERWIDYYKKHIREAFKGCGYDSVVFYPEPFAVFRYYCNQLQDFKNPSGEELILVIDIGGGTSVSYTHLTLPTTPYV